MHVSAVWAASAPEWMRAQVNAPVPAHDDETDAVVLYSETELTVLAPGKMKRLERRVYKILRSNGEAYGVVRTEFTPQSRVTSMHGWSIPAQGKDFEVKDRDVIETAITNVDGGELISDVRRKVMQIPASVPGSIIGYEIEQEMQPYEMTDEWDIQDTLPVREARYTVRLPSSWSYKVFWLNHDESAPTEVAPGQWRWVATDLKPVKLERRMPPWQGIAARMVLSLQPPGGKGGGFQSWQEVGTWYLGLANGRRDPSPQLRQKVQELTASATDPLSKMRALAVFVQKDIRYVAIELGVGGVQPHPASEVLTHGYGDCKDKVTLLSSMLKEIGVESHYVLINTERGSVAAGTPPNMGFNHAILAIQLPAGVDTTQLPAVIAHKTLGPVLFFDPTHPLISLGYLPGALQANYRHARDARRRRADRAPADLGRAERRGAYGEIDARRERHFERGRARDLVRRWRGRPALHAAHRAAGRGSDQAGRIHADPLAVDVSNPARDRGQPESHGTAAHLELHRRDPTLSADRG